MKKYLLLLFVFSFFSIKGQVSTKTIDAKVYSMLAETPLSTQKIVDHILGKLQLSDKEKAIVDTNKDNMIDISDVTSYISAIIYNYYLEKAANDKDYVDLGITNSEGKTIYWASYNIGAFEEKEFGNYYAWGDKDAKTYFSNDSYNPVENNEDIANLIWGGEWRLPSQEEMQLLINNCDWTPITEGTIGYKITSRKNGKSIFLPAATMYNQSGQYISGSKYEGCYYWTSTKEGTDKAKYFAAYPKTHDANPPSFGSSDFYFGRTIRPVFIMNIPNSSNIYIPIFDGDDDEEADPNIEVLAPTRKNTEITE